MKDNSKLIRKKDTEKWHMLQKINMRGNGRMIRNVGKDQWLGQMHMKNILDNGNKIYLMVMANIFGLKTKHNTKYLRMCIKEIGKMEKEKDLVLFFIPMVADFKDISLKIWNKDLEL